MLMYACCKSAFAATSPLATTNDYYYTVPKTGRIYGRVMGEHADYSLVRNEDVAFINEAWAERKALGNEMYAVGTVVAGGTLVKGGTQGINNTRDYWSGSPESLKTCMVTNGIMGDMDTMEAVEKCVYVASEGAMTNAERRIDGFESGKLVRVEALTNAFEKLKEMKIVVKRVSATDTQWTKSVRKIQTKYVDTKMDPDTWYENYEITNNVSGRIWSLDGHGYKMISRWSGHGEEIEWLEDYSMTETTEREELQGKAKIRMEFYVKSTNDWLRGRESPKVVKSAHAWGITQVGGEKLDYWVKVNLEEGRLVTETNWYNVASEATVLLDLGEASWVEAKEGRLAYEVEVSPMELLMASAGAVTGMVTPGEVVSAATVPELSADEGEREVRKWVGGTIHSIFLVIELLPVASLPGW